ncbi:ubiquinol-cytochrome c reductase iron-sulfur subunit [Aliiroseovarius sp. YM-037]|uniref:ubiquinol-cytochrome c reductase iron-sulfur subunit n=1 Tax=Aliiroseovarius sp. YM-037 TaxID=3341728 RepID=UPI003A80DC59
MPDPEPHSSSRRNFLSYATTGFVATAVGAGIWGLGRALAPDASVLTTKTLTIDLDIVPAGEQHVYLHVNKPVFVRRLTAEQVAAVADTDITSLHDRFAQNRNLDDFAEATVVNRTISTSDGTFVVVVGTCTRNSCVTMFDFGDFGGWFCACCSTHYDVIGRRRKGIAPRNLDIPRFAVSQNTLTILPVPGQLSREHYLDLLFGSGGA